jgi:Na+-driven multidrug efflux pump
MIAGAFLVSFSVMNMGISAQRSFSIQLPVYLICTITIFIGSIALVPKFGINGAAYAYAISNFSGFIFCFFVFIKNIKKDSNENISKSTTRLQG